MRHNLRRGVFVGLFRLIQCLIFGKFGDSRARLLCWVKDDYGWVHY